MLSAHEALSITAEVYRALSPAELRRRAIEFSDAVKERNPPASQVTEMLKIAQQVQEQ